MGTVVTAKTPSGFVCECGLHQTFSPWVYAHWDDMLHVTCPKCRALYTLRQGVASLALGVPAKYDMGAR